MQNGCIMIKLLLQFLNFLEIESETELMLWHLRKDKQMRPIYGPDSVSATRFIQLSLWWLGSTGLHVIQVLFLEALL